MAQAAPAVDWDSYFGAAAPPGPSIAPAATGAAVGAGAAAQPAGAPGAPGDQWESWLREPALAASSVLKGALSIPQIPGMVSNALFRGLDVLTGANVAPTLAPAMAPSQAIAGAPARGAAALGLVDNPALAPQGLGENLLAGGAAALPYAAADVLSGGAATPALLTAGGAGVAAEAAHQIAPESTALPIIAGALTGHIIGRGASAVQTLQATRQAEAVADEAAANYAQLVKNAPTTTKGFRDQLAAGRASADASHQAAMLNIGQVHDATMLGHQTTLDNTAAGLGNSETFEDAGQILQPATRQWLLESHPAQQKAAWQPFDEALPSNTPAPDTNFQATVASLGKDAGPLQDYLDTITPPLARAMKVKQTAKAAAADLTGVPQPVPTIANLAAMRTGLGDKLAGPPQMTTDLGTQNTEALYKALTADMRTAAVNSGNPSAVSLFDQSNAESKRLFRLAEGPMKSVVAGPVESAADQAPGAMAARLLAAGQKDGSTLAALRAEMPDAMDELGAVAIRTGQWPKLTDSAKHALVPDPYAHMAVDNAFQGKAASIEETKAAVAAAKAQQQGQLAALQQAHDEQQFQFSQQKADTSFAAKQARAAASRLRAGPPANALMHGVGALIGGEAGGELGTVAGEAMGLPGSDLYHGAVGKIAGLTIPWTVRKGMGMISSLYNNPAVRRSTALGAAVGSTYASQSQPPGPGAPNALGASQ